MCESETKRSNSKYQNLIMVPDIQVLGEQFDPLVLGHAAFVLQSDNRPDRMPKE